MDHNFKLSSSSPQEIANNSRYDPNCSVTSALWSADAGNCNQLGQNCFGNCSLQGLFGNSVNSLFNKTQIYRESQFIFISYRGQKGATKLLLYHRKTDCLD